MGRTRRFASVLGLALPALLSLATARAAIINWTAAPATPSNWFTPANWTTAAVPGAIDTASINNGGTAIISSGSAAVDALAVGQVVNSTLNQTGGSLTLNTGSIGAGSFYNFSGGALTINNSGQFNVLGQLNFGFGTSSIMVNDSGVLDLSKGSVLNTSNTSITAAANTVVYLPVGVSTSSFKSFSSLGEVYQVNGTALVVPVGFTMTISQDRSDQIQVQGTLKGPGSSLTLNHAGVLITPGGTFDMTSSGSLYVQTTTGSGMTGGTLNMYSYGGSLSVYNASSNATFTQSGGVANAPSLTVGNGGSYNGRYIQSGGTTNSSYLTVLGASQFTLSGGTSNVTKAMSVSSGSLYTLSGGTLSLAATATLNVSAGGVFDFAGGNGTLTLGSGAIADFSAGSITNTANATYSAATNSESYFPRNFNPYVAFQSFSSQGLVHSTGTVLLIPLHTATTVTNLTADSVSVAGSLTLAKGGTITATQVSLSGGSLNGGGTITAPVANDGILAPGMSPGEITIEGDYTQYADGLLDIELGGLAAGTQFDHLIITGDAMLDGTLRLSLVNGFVPVVGETFDIINAGAVTGNFDQLTNFTGYNFDVSTVSNGTVVRLTVESLPEPGTLGFLIVGGSLLLRRRRA